MGTVTKALSLLGLFARATPELGLSELARRSGLNKTTTYRLMSELAAQGFVEQVGAGRAYRLGPAFLRLAALREQAVPMRETVQAVVTELAAATGETAHFSLLEGETLSTLAYAYSPAHGTSVLMDDAEVLTFHGTSSGIAVLAFAPGDFVDRVLGEPLAARTPETVTDPQAIRATLAGVRRSGVAVSVGGFEVDVVSHAAPVFDNAARVVGAVAVAAPVTRMTDDLAARVRAAVIDRARHLTRLTGGFLPHGFPDPAPPLPIAQHTAPMPERIQP
ncbi:MAG: IclR family transcriptional regulator [Maritimibacter sp.]|nr:IclR family transcriptional regulator [Maritimibacter sp.]